MLAASGDGHGHRVLFLIRLRKRLKRQVSHEPPRVTKRTHDGHNVKPIPFRTIHASPDPQTMRNIGLDVTLLTNSTRCISASRSSSGVATYSFLTRSTSRPNACCRSSRNAHTSTTGLS